VGGKGWRPAITGLLPLVAAVKVNKDITNTGETETALQPVCPQSKSRGRRTIEIASFDHVFAPYIKPPA
jgi:hypothetical protein